MPGLLKNVPPAVLPRTLPAPHLRWIMNDASRSIVNMKGFASSIDVNVQIDFFLVLHFALFHGTPEICGDYALTFGGRARHPVFYNGLWPADLACHGAT